MEYTKELNTNINGFEKHNAMVLCIYKDDFWSKCWAMSWHTSSDFYREVCPCLAVLGQVT